MADNIEKNANKFSQSRPENGREFEQMQNAQNQLLQIQAGRQQNLLEQRMADSSIADQNALMRQAAELSAMGGNMQVNQATQAAMGRYGLRPQTTSSSKQIKTPQGIVINNNTTNITTVPANIGGPLQGRPLQFQAGNSAGENSKFKDWINKAFDKQNEEAKKRDREYSRRETSLTKSSNKIMRKLEEFSRDITKKLDPRNIGRTVGGQIGTIFKLFGMGYLAANTGKILDGIKSFTDKTKNLFEWIKGEKKETPEFIKNFTESFKKSFGDIIFGENAAEKMKAGGLIGGLKITLDEFLEKVNKQFNERLKLAKSANSNTEKLSLDPVKSLEVMLTRVGNLISILFGGEPAYQNIISNQISNVSQRNGRKHYGVNNEKDLNRHAVYIMGLDGKLHTVPIQSQNIGDQNAIRGKIDDRAEIPGQYMNKDGSIDLSAGSTLAVSNNIVANIGHKNTAHLATSLSNLYNAAETSGSVMVHKDLTGKLTNGQIETLKSRGDITEIKFNTEGYKFTDRTYNKLNKDDQKDLMEGNYFAYVDPFSWWLVSVPKEEEEIYRDFKNGGRDQIYINKRIEVENRAISSKVFQLFYYDYVTKGTPTRDIFKSSNKPGGKSSKMLDYVIKSFQKYSRLTKSDFDGTPKPGEVFFGIVTVIAPELMLMNESQQGYSTLTSHYQAQWLQAKDFTITGKGVLAEHGGVGKNNGGIAPNKVWVAPGFVVERRMTDEEAKEIVFVTPTALRAISPSFATGADGVLPASENGTTVPIYTGEYGTAGKPSMYLAESIHNKTMDWKGKDDINTDWDAISNYTSSKKPSNFVEVSNPDTPSTEGASGDFNIQKAVNYIAGHASTNGSTGWCARNVRAALEAGGLDTTGRPGYGGAYGPWLEQHGWKKVTDGSILPGDVEVIAPTGNHRYGHIQMWGGDTYYSDFKQEKEGQVYGSNTKRVRYRYKDSDGAAISGPTIPVGSLGTEVDKSPYPGGNDINHDSLEGASFWDVVKDGISKVWNSSKAVVREKADGTLEEIVGTQGYINNNLANRRTTIDVNSKFSGLTRDVLRKYSGADYTGGALGYLDKFGISGTNRASRRVLSSLFDENGQLRINTDGLNPELASSLKTIEKELKKGNEIDIAQVNLTAAGIDTTISTSRANSILTAQSNAGLRDTPPSSESQTINVS